MKFQHLMLLLIAFFFAGLLSARAMNWEGHDDWLEDQNHGQSLEMILPKPRIKDFPSCQERRKQAELNPYEQRALPGQNCYEDDEGEGSEQFN